MKSRWSVVSLAVFGLLVAAIAFAADKAKTQTPAAPKAAADVQAGDAGGGHAWTWVQKDEGDDDLMSDEFGDDDGAGGGTWTFRGGPGPGGQGMGMGWMQRLHGMHGMHGGGMGRGMGMGAGRGRGMGMGRGMGAAFARLDLTDAQREKLADIHERQMRRNVQARADLQLARMDLHKLMKAESPNTAAINAQIDKLAKLRADMQKTHVATFVEARGLLTPEQRKQLREPGPGGPGRGMMFHRGPQDDGTKSD